MKKIVLLVASLFGVFLTFAHRSKMFGDNGLLLLSPSVGIYNHGSHSSHRSHASHYSSSNGYNGKSNSFTGHFSSISVKQDSIKEVSKTEISRMISFLAQCHDSNNNFINICHVSIAKGCEIHKDGKCYFKASQNERCLYIDYKVPSQNKKQKYEYKLVIPLSANKVYYRINVNQSYMVDLPKEEWMNSFTKKYTK